MENIPLEETHPVRSPARITRRWSSTTWVLASLALVILLISGDLVRRAIVGPPKAPPKPPPAPTLALGSPAIDFELPDMTGKPHRLSDFKGKRFVLNFFCGCEECRHFAEHLAKAYKATRKPAPPTLVVMTAHYEPSATPSFIRSTGSDHFTYLFATDQPDIVEKYNGHPCPKTYVFNPDFKVAYASQVARAGSYFIMIHELSKVLGLNYSPKSPAFKGKAKPPAPATHS
jgi:peroxiredoxin